MATPTEKNRMGKTLRPMKKSDEDTNEIEQQDERAAPVAQAKPVSTGVFDFLIRAKVVPKMFLCKGYRPVHRVDSGCHTKLPYSIPTILSHMRAGDGGGFEVNLGVSRGAWKGWQDLNETEDVVISDFRCGVCQNVLDREPGTLLAHMKPHAGHTNRRIIKGGKFLITLGSLNFSAPVFVDPEDELDDVELIDIAS